MIMFRLLIVVVLYLSYNYASRSTPSPSSVRNINQQFLELESNGNDQTRNIGNQPKHASQVTTNGPQYVPKSGFNTNNNIGSSVVKSSSNIQANISSKNANSGNSNFQSLPINNGQSNVKQLVQMYNNREEETRRPQQPGRTNGKPFSYSSVVAGTHKQTAGNISPQMNAATALPMFSVLFGNQPVSQTSTPRSNKRELVSDDELRQMSEALLKKDTNNAAKLIRVNYQGHASSSSKIDQAPLPLLEIPPEVWNISTIRTMQALWDNYEQDSFVNEYVTPMEKNEENVFLDAILETPVMRHLMNFLKEKGVVTPDPRQQKEYLKQIWFNMYSRGRGKIGSSGFEHVFLVEIKNNQISGFHNWLYMYVEEAANRANYLGYLKKTDIGDKGAILKFHFTYKNIDKPVDSMFVGTSPELEIALYTMCFALRADVACPITLSGKYITIRTYTFRYRSKNMIGSAYPEI